MFEHALVIEYLSQSGDKIISGIRMKNSIFESHVGKMLVTWVTLMTRPLKWVVQQWSSSCTNCVASTVILVPFRRFLKHYFTFLLFKKSHNIF